MKRLLKAVFSTGTEGDQQRRLRFGAKFALMAVLAFASAGPVEAFTLSKGGRAQCVIVSQTGATESERHAATELAENLGQVIGGTVAVTNDLPATGDVIVVGRGAAAAALFPDVDWTEYGADECIMRVQGRALLLGGGRPRGTLYAVYQFLQREAGVRWWTPWASNYPARADWAIEELNRREQPAFEYREPFWYVAFEAKWAARHGYNGDRAPLEPKHGGKISYRGFVHTFYPLVPPSEHFATHPEWFSWLDGRRTTERAQLCLSNPELREFMVGQVKNWLRQAPQAGIISVSQNDWYGTCQCADCKAIDDAEGSPAGSMLAFVNYVAEKIEPEFPAVAIDTLAYQYTRRPPRTLKPRKNVIVRLCSIECNFAQPLDHPTNQSFADDIRNWASICDRLYIWDYTTDFAHYVQPHPNWFVLGPNLRFFQKHHVRGVFEQGAYQSHGSEMAELRAWVLAQLLWNPGQDDVALIREFLAGYYGAAADPIFAYLQLMKAAAAGHKLTCFSSDQAAFLSFPVLAQAEELWRAAEDKVREDATTLWRVRQAHLPVQYSWLVRWGVLREQCEKAGAVWPWAVSRGDLAQQWLALATGPGPQGWTPMTLINESGVTPQKFVERFRE